MLLVIRETFDEISATILWMIAFLGDRMVLKWSNVSCFASVKIKERETDHVSASAVERQSTCGTLSAPIVINKEAKVCGSLVPYNAHFYVTYRSKTKCCKIKRSMHA